MLKVYAPPETSLVVRVGLQAMTFNVVAEAMLIGTV